MRGFGVTIAAAGVAVGVAADGVVWSVAVVLLRTITGPDSTHGLTFAALSTAAARKRSVGPAAATIAPIIGCQPVPSTWNSRVTWLTPLPASCADTAGSNRSPGA